MRSQVSPSIEVCLLQEETDVAFHYISKIKWHIASLSRYGKSKLNMEG